MEAQYSTFSLRFHLLLQLGKLPHDVFGFAVEDASGGEEQAHAAAEGQHPGHVGRDLGPGVGIPPRNRRFSNTGGIDFGFRDVVGYDNRKNAVKGGNRSLGQAQRGPANCRRPLQCKRNKE